MAKLHCVVKTLAHSLSCNPALVACPARIHGLACKNADARTPQMASALLHCICCNVSMHPECPHVNTCSCPNVCRSKPYCCQICCCQIFASHAVIACPELELLHPCGDAAAAAAAIGTACRTPASQELHALPLGAAGDAQVGVSIPEEGVQELRGCARSIACTHGGCLPLR